MRIMKQIISSKQLFKYEKVKLIDINLNNMFLEYI